jgi:hypothetical protein
VSITFETVTTTKTVLYMRFKGRRLRVDNEIKKIERILGNRSPEPVVAVSAWGMSPLLVIRGLVEEREREEIVLEDYPKGWCSSYLLERKRFPEVEALLGELKKLREDLQAGPTKVVTKC